MQSILFRMVGLLASTTLLGTMGCDRLEPADFTNQKLGLICDQWEACGELESLGISYGQCLSIVGDDEETCGADLFDHDKAEDCLEQIESRSCNDLDDPLEDHAASCEEVCEG